MTDNTTIYKNRLLMRHKCIDYSIITYKYLKDKKYEFIKSIQVKRHLINEDNPNYDPYHYYIEVKIMKNNKLFKMIIDNEDYYNYHFYKSRYSPKRIQKINHKRLINAYRTIDINLQDFIKMVIMDIDYKIQDIMKYI